MPPVDFSVFTGAAQTQFGPDIQKVMQMQALQMRMQQLQQIQQGENVLRSLYQNKDNLDSATNTLRPEAVNKLMQLSPSAGQDYMAQAAQIEERRARGSALKSEAWERGRKAANEIGVEALSVYDDNLNTKGPQLAMRAGQDRLSELLAGAKASGAMLPEQLEKFNPHFEPITFRSHQKSYEASQAKPAQPITPYQSAKLGLEEAGLEQRKRDERRKDADFRRGEFGTSREVELPDGRKVVAQQSKDTSEWVTADEKREPLPTPTRVIPAGKQDTLHPSKEIAIVDKDGSVVERFAARESGSGPGWVRSDDGKPVVVPPGGKIDVGQAAGAVIGSRENVYIGRVLTGAVTATSDLENISKMPIVSSGIFGGRKQGPGLLDAVKEDLANTVTSRDVQVYNSANTGIQRALAVIESSGLAPSGAFTDQFNGLTLKEGDDQMTKIYKMANARQIVENGMEVLKNNPRVAPEQKKLAEQYVNRVQGAIPWTTSDVIKLMTSDNPNDTLHNLGVGKTGKGEASPGSSMPPRAGTNTPSGIGIYQP